MEVDGAVVNCVVCSNSLVIQRWHTLGKEGVLDKCEIKRWQQPKKPLLCCRDKSGASQSLLHKCSHAWTLSKVVAHISSTWNSSIFGKARSLV